MKEISVLKYIAFIPCFGTEILPLMKKFAEEIKLKFAEIKDPYEFAACMHQEMIKIHPYDDGNGRMTRLMMNLILKQLNEKPVLIDNDTNYNEGR